MRDTTFTRSPRENRDTWGEQYAEEQRFDTWFAEFFVERLEPSARGGFENAEEEGSDRFVSVCRPCGALILNSGWGSFEYLNVHRAWHDKNDRSNADG